VSPTLVTLASPLLEAVTAVSGAVLHGAGGAFQKLLHARDNATPAGEANPLHDDPLAGLQARAEALLEQLESRSLAQLAASGISLDSPLALESDALGNLHAGSGHPQAAAIERALAGDPRLAKLVQELKDTQRRLAGERDAAAHDRLFALDPDAARKQLDQPSRLDEPPVRVTLRPREFTR
jgi:hypothetical protein